MTVHIKGRARVSRLSSVKDSIPLWGDSSLDPSFPGDCAPVGVWRSPHCSCWFLPPGCPLLSSLLWALHPERRHLDSKGRPHSLWTLLALSHRWRPGAPGTGPLRRLSRPVRKLTAGFSPGCQLLPVLPIRGQISRAGMGFPWEMRAATQRFFLNEH